MDDVTKQAVDAFEEEAKAGGFWDKIICMTFYPGLQAVVIKPRLPPQHDDNE